MRVLKYHRWYTGDPITSSGNNRNEAVYVAGTEKITLFVDIRTVAGTSPSLDLYIDVYDELTNDWYELAHVGTFTATGATMHTVNVDGGQCFALRWVVGGTNPEFDILIAAEFRGD